MVADPVASTGSPKSNGVIVAGTLTENLLEMFFQNCLVRFGAAIYW